MSDSSPVITIDGPSGSGKGTICRMLAQTLGWHLLDSGALYRLLAMAAKNHSVAFEDEATLEVLAGHLDAQFITDELDGRTQTILEGEDVTDTMRTEEWGNAASIVGALPAVRQALLDRQRAFREWPGLIADGRDMGTVIFPDAQLKIFLVASREERAKRRFLQLQGKGIKANIEQILDDIVERDDRDIKRAVAPLKPAADAMLIDTTGVDVDDVLHRVMQQVEKRFADQIVSA